MKANFKKLIAALLAFVIAFSVVGMLATEEVEASNKPGKPTISYTVTNNIKWKYSTDKNGNKYRCKYTRVKITWKKVSGADGYEIYDGYADGNERYAGAVYSYTRDIKQINAKYAHNYRFKVRAYKNVNGKRVYGPWSKSFLADMPTGKWEYYT